MLTSLAHSCNGHLIKRVITQNPRSLALSIDIACATVLEGLVDPKKSVASSCISILNDCWMACPEETDSIFIQCGLLNSKDTVQLQCLDILTSRVASSTTFAFKIFTPSVVKLLNSSSSQCSHKASDLLIMFFKNAKDAAKTDLARQLHLHNINEHTRNSILHSINYTITSREPSSHSGHNSSNPSLSVLSIQFLLDDPMYAVESINPEKIISIETFKREISEMTIAFEGKETEFNWQQRDKNISRLRSLLRGNDSKQDHDLLIWAFKYLSSGILKGAHSLRTTLSSSSCQLVKEISIILNHGIDSISDIFISSIIKLTALSKKITHTVANITVSALYANTSYSYRALNYIPAILNEKNIQPRIYSAKWLRIIIYCHRNVKSIIESSGGRDIIESCIFKGLSDASPGVREEMRQTFWTFNEIWPSVGQSMLLRMDSSIRKILERSNPQPVASISSVSARPSRAGSSIRGSIAQSKERNPLPNASRKPLDRVSKMEKPAEAPKDLTAKPARLGITQKAQRRIVINSSNSSGSKTTPKFGTSDISKPVRPSSSNTNYHNIPSSPPEAIKEKEKSTVFLTSEKTSTQASLKELTLTEQIKSDTPEVVTRALQTIVNAWINPHENVVELPSTQLLGKFFKHLFSIGPNKLSKERWNLIYILTNPSVITNVTQFVPITEVCLGIVHTQPENLCVDALKEIFNQLGSDRERASLSVYVISNCLEMEDEIKAREAALNYCLDLLRDIYLTSLKSKSILKEVKLLELALTSGKTNSSTLEKVKNVFSSYFSEVPKNSEVDVNLEISNSLSNPSGPGEIFSNRVALSVSGENEDFPTTSKSPKSVVVNSKFDNLVVSENHASNNNLDNSFQKIATTTEDVNQQLSSLSKNGLESTFQAEPDQIIQQVVESEFQNLAESSRPASPLLSSSVDVRVDSPQSNSEQPTETVDPDTMVIHVDEFEKQPIDDSSENIHLVSDNAMDPREDFATVSNKEDILMEDSLLGDSKSLSESSNIFDLDTLKRKTPEIEIFHDSVASSASPVGSDSPHGPKSKQLEMDWLKTETALSSLSLLSNESESDFNARNDTIEKLIEKLGAHEISNHGLNKLVSIVKDLDSKDLQVWKENGWLKSILSNLFLYLDDSSLTRLTADQANKALLLVNYFLIFKISSFSDYELQLLNILFRLHDLCVSDKRSLIRGLTFVRNQLIDYTNILSNDVLLQASLKDYDDAWNAKTTTPQHKVFLLATFEKAIVQGNDSKFSRKVGEVVLEGLRATEAIVRKQAYSLMLHLVKITSDQALIEDMLLSKLKDSERRLFEYYQRI